MTTDEVNEIETVIHECDPDAEIQWDREHGTLTVTCSSECSEAVRRAVIPRAFGVVLVVRRRG